MSDKVTAVVRDVTKTFYVGNKGSQRSIFQRRKRIRVDAVKSANFVSYAGECIGILGRNGSGKSTLLSMIAGNEAPTTGTVLVSSAPTLLGVSAALQSHLSGRDNVRLGLLAMGLSPEEVADMQDSVLEWAELGEAGDRPMSTYSSGMRSRLKFGIATAVRRELLLVDEALSTGDATFNAKAKKRMDDFLTDAGTVFIVSHAAGTIEKYCSRVIWIHDGEIIADGRPKRITHSYRLWSKRVSVGNEKGATMVLDRMRERYVEKRIILDTEAVKIMDDALSSNSQKPICPRQSTKINSSGKKH